MPATEKIKFSVNIWTHLYSLSQAIKFQQNNSGRCLIIEGEFNHAVLSSSQTQTIQLSFIHNIEPPCYETGKNNRIIFAPLKTENEKSVAQIPVANDVFNELKKNLIEYADIEGIHIVVSLELLANPLTNEWNIVELDYAMKGDR